MVRIAPQKHASIAGGFVPIPVGQLMAAWCTCRSKPLGIGDFRAWLAANEMVARRRHAGEGRAPAYRASELAALLGVTPRRAAASARRLVAAGLLEWSDEAIGFSATTGPAEGPDDSIGRGRGDLAVPRRLLRLLARGARPALLATALGILLRCLSRRRAGWDGRGRIKAAWVATTFGVDLRRVKQARAELVALGWVAPEHADQRALNRWGPAYRIDLGWAPPGQPGAPRLPPPPAPERREIATPSVDRDPPPGRENNQEPAPGGPAGASLERTGEETLPPPRLEDVRVEDLKDTDRTLELHRQAVARGLVTASEADRLRVVAAAEHALSVGKTNPPGLFRHLLAGRSWRYLTGQDEDRANTRIKRHLRPAMASASPLATAPFPRVPVLSEDARLVREVRTAAIRAGHYRDPFPLVAARDRSWTRDRWERALAEVQAV